MITKLNNIVDKIKEKGLKRVSVACGEDPHTIEAVGKAVEQGIVKAVLTGNKEKIIEVAKKYKVDYNSFDIIDEPDKKKALSLAISMIQEGQCDFLMKGLIDSALYMRGIIEATKEAIKGDITLSHVSIIELPTYPKLLIASDIAVIPYPDLKQKIAILNYSIQAAKKLEIENPKAAIICAVEKVNPKMNPTIEAAILSKMADRGQIKGAIVDGPLALDVAVSEESKKIKRVDSIVAGDADILIFPNIDAGNVFFKTCTNLAKGNVAAIVTGAFCPCVLTSRSDSELSKFYSIAFGALMVDR